ncbi:MAG: hypothetical protein AAF581_01690 [Planctomycetota bacterium]
MQPDCLVRVSAAILALLLSPLCGCVNSEKSGTTAAFAHANPEVVLNDTTLVALRERILAAPQDLAWESIAWRPSLWEAVLEGDREERPVLLWAMNGHPLGCT